MKIRSGYVSNSSSSSFIVSFPKGFEPTHENVKNYLFPDGANNVFVYDYHASVEDVVDCVVRDMTEQKPNNIPMLLKELEDVADDQAPDLDNFKSPENDRMYDWEAYEAALRDYAEIQMTKYDFKTEDLYIFSYSDNDGRFFTVMEHGDIFSAVKHKRFSHH
jgi:hypothetical protein